MWRWERDKSFDYTEAVDRCDNHNPAHHSSLHHSLPAITYTRVSGAANGHVPNHLRAVTRIDTSPAVHYLGICSGRPGR
jgi:hypothetical protein